MSINIKIFIWVFHVIGRDGIKEIIELPLNGVDQAKFDESYEILEK